MVNEFSIYDNRFIQSINFDVAFISMLIYASQTFLNMIFNDCNSKRPILPYYAVYSFVTLQWRHNGHGSVSNHEPNNCLLNHLFRRKYKKISKLRVTGLCAENSPGTSDFPGQVTLTRKMFPFDDGIMQAISSFAHPKGDQYPFSVLVFVAKPIWTPKKLRLETCFCRYVVLVI